MERSFSPCKDEIQNFIDIRNYLVHYFARDFDLTDAESCRKAFDDLKKKSKVVKDAIEFFDQDYNMMKRVLQECCEGILKLLAQSENDIARGRVIHQKDLFKSLEKIL